LSSPETAALDVAAWRAPPMEMAPTTNIATVVSVALIICLPLTERPSQACSRLKKNRSCGFRL
jgi:hypothetical protein